MFEGKEESRADGKPSEPVFFYNREERIKHAPKEVQDYYNGNWELQKGIKVLVKNKANRFFLIALVVVTAFAMFISRAEARKNQSEIGGYKTELSAFSYEDTVYVKLKIYEDTKVAQKKGNKKVDETLKDPKVFSVDFSVLNSDAQVVDSHSDELLMEKDEETISFTLSDYEIAQIKAQISCGDEKTEVVTGIKK